MAANDTLFSAQEWLRYTRHIQLQGFGAAGQARLKAAHVLMVGMGGLGAPVGLYLAAAGVGRMTIYDGDCVDLTNLQRQVIFTMDDIGQPKAEAAKRHLLALNPNITIDVVTQPFSKDQAESLSTTFDLVLDCTDNFPTRYLINDFCVTRAVPWVYASVHQYAGQCALFTPGGACFRCVFPEAPETIEDCNSAGVIGVLPGLLGLLQSNEALRYLSGQVPALSNQLLLFDAAKLSMQKIALAPDAQCVCQNAMSHTLQDDYAFSCESVSGNALEVSPEDFHRLRDQKTHSVLDVREQDERQSFHLGGVHIPMNEIHNNLDKIDKTKTVLCYCQSGKRSYRVAEQLVALGYPALSVSGGLSSILKVAPQ